MPLDYKILTGDNRITLKTIADNSIDAIITDPPYGIDFLNKSWDANTGALETYQECLRVLKPGGHILAFSAARTYHHLAITLEQAGFEIRDQIMWIYSSGFPKSQDVGRQLHKKANGKPDKQRFDPNTMIKVEGDRYQHSTTGKIYRALPDINGDRLAVSHEGEKYGTVYEEVIVVDNEWSGWGTQLKPAHEPICLARKPLKQSIAKNCQEWGVGALNIDATRVPYVNEEDIKSAQFGRPSTDNHSYINTEAQQTRDNLDVVQANEQGRFPSNVIGEIPDYQKYFYCPKVSRKERHIGFDDDTLPVHWDMVSAMGGYYVDEHGNRDDERAFGGKNIYLPHKGMIFGHGLKHEYAEWCKTNNKNPGNVGNNHPTVKPIELMRYLIRLITPPGGTVLDPFTGSGSTGCAAVELDHPYIGCELDPHYVSIAHTRIQAWYEHTHDVRAEELFDTGD